MIYYFFNNIFNFLPKVLLLNFQDGRAIVSHKKSEIEIYFKKKK